MDNYLYEEVESILKHLSSIKYNDVEKKRIEVLIKLLLDRIKSIESDNKAIKAQNELMTRWLDKMFDKVNYIERID